MTEIEIRSRSFGALSGVKVSVTNKLREKLEDERTRDGSTLFGLLSAGRAVRGLKHLLETIKQSNADARIVFTHSKTRREGNSYFINLFDYRDAGSSRFFQLYRATGLDVAINFLSESFPKEFHTSERRMQAVEISTVERNYEQVVERLSRKRENQMNILRQTSALVKNLEMKKRLLAEDLKELDRLRKTSAIAYYQDKLKELRERLTKKLPETSGHNSWQSWIQRENWVFGSHYQQPIEKERVGLDSIPDYLFPTLDGFVDILEIKLPTHPVIRKDTSHSGSYCWASDANKAIGQVVNYIREIEINQLQLAERLNERYGEALRMRLQTVKPRAYILIGRSETLKDQEKRALRSLNSSLHGIEVLTYDEILLRGEHLVALYSHVDDDQETSEAA